MQLSQTENYKARLYKSGLFVFYSGGGGTRKSVAEAREKQKTTQRIYTVKKTKLRSACVALWQNRRNKTLLFVTVTCAQDIEEGPAARAWLLFLKNIDVNCNVGKYVWVKERQKSGRLHYHILFDAKYIPVKYMQHAWETSFLSATGHKDLHHCSVRLGDRPIVRDLRRVSRYLSKYVSKGAEPFLRRAYGNSVMEISTEVDATDLYAFLRSRRPPIYVWKDFLVVGEMDFEDLEAFALEYG